MQALIDVSWPGVVLVLGIVGMSLGTVCFAIWTTKRRCDHVHVPLPPPPKLEPWPGEAETKVDP